MTSPLVNPAAGNSTLSRLDSSSCCPSTLTSTLRLLLIDDLFRRLVGAQPQETREPQPPVAGTLPELHLDHLLRPYPDRGPRIVAGQPLGERVAVGAQRQQQFLQLLLGD